MNGAQRMGESEPKERGMGGCSVFDGSAVDHVCDILQLIVDTLLEGGIVVDFHILDFLAVTVKTKSEEHHTPRNY